MDLSEINYLAVLAGAAFNMVLGSLWYGPLFGKLWMKFIEKKPEEIKSNPLLYIFSFVAAFVAGSVLYLVVLGFAFSTFGAGLLAGVVCWLGFVTTATLTFSIFEGPKLSVWLLFILYQLVIFAVLGGLFAIW